MKKSLDPILLLILVFLIGVVVTGVSKTDLVQQATASAYLSNN